MVDQAQSEQELNVVDQAVAEGGAYELIRSRLVEQGKTLQTETKRLNEARLEEFGSTDMSILGRVRIRTENNCIARDIARVGQFLVFGYNVFIGLKKETKVEDVFSLYQLVETDGNYDVEAVSLSGSFLAHAQFVKEFRELYSYYKHARLLQISVQNQKLLASFQVGEKVSDIKVFRWSISADQSQVDYIDNRGERDIALPARHDFEWLEVTRDYSVHGRYPHFNILDKVFVETVGGDLTIKVEDNTEDGLGIYREDVEDKTQSLDDADIYYAELGDLILLKIKPYRETLYRHFIFNCATQDVVRVDAIGESCVQLPESHGLIFPGGYYLASGELKIFDDLVPGLRFKRTIKSPNGEDVLFIFYEPVAGSTVLSNYNLITKELQNPISCHGQSVFDDGRAVIFNAEGDEPTRIHPMQIWNTPFFSEEFASKQPASQSFYGRIGNSELVRGISDLYSICRAIVDQQPSSYLYTELQKNTRRIFDAYHWIESDNTHDIGAVLREVVETSELILDEFEKVESIRQASIAALKEAASDQRNLLSTVHPDRWTKPAEFVDALASLRRQFGRLLSLKDLRYVDLDKISVLEIEVTEVQEKLGQDVVQFLSRDEALLPYTEQIKELEEKLQKVESIVEIEPLLESIKAIAEGLDLLSEMMATLSIRDATLRTQIIDAISEVYASLNQLRAKANNKEQELGQGEAVAQFSAQFRLFSQSITNALGSATTPEKCDEQLSRLLMQLEELEAEFSRYDEFLENIVTKREEVYESFEGRKQQLLDEQQRRAQSVADAADRIIDNIQKRLNKFSSIDDLNTYFSSDALVLKSRDLVQQLHELDSSVKADDLDARLKGAKDQAVRAIRDKSDIYEDGGNVIKLGPKHKFNVNTQELDLTIIPRDGALCFHLIGTDFYANVTDSALSELAGYWGQNLASENEDTYRAEYLAYSLYQDAQLAKSGLSIDVLSQALENEAELLKLVRDYAAPRYKEGYEKGVHDHDAARILHQLLPILSSCDLLRYTPTARGLASVFWANTQTYDIQSGWPSRAKSALQMQAVFGSSKALRLLSHECAENLTRFCSDHALDHSDSCIAQASEYLVYELARDHVEFICSKYAQLLSKKLKQSMELSSSWRAFQSALKEIEGQVGRRWLLTESWLLALCDGLSDEESSALKHYIPEAISLINAEGRLSRRNTEVELEFSVEGLLGQHKNVSKQALKVSVDRFLSRLYDHQYRVIPEYNRFLDVRQQVIDKQRAQLRLDEFKPKPLSSFVRNKLINESYLPIIGDNLAKQMGTVGDKKRSDLMGLLMMISPPGYGKTTLMEYVASRLGLIFMKINCPSLGHEVDSLDPSQAPNATAKQELNKLNLALEMGSNVMLYLDDIQHTNPEFLQKFISLCDGTRRIEGVWQGETKTYDMRGRKFCVVMAGNPYTESGELFKIPDMLANRADIYNLGDVLGGKEDIFALSYVENCLTSNPVLAPMATRELSDLYKLADKANGLQVANTDLSHSYSGAEVNEIVSVLNKLFKVRDVILKVNAQYIKSAAQGDDYRTEPPFKLQGSYRNMNKMAEKISAVMNDDELQQVIADHYLGEAQLLTTGAEENLLKLKELRQVLTESESERWLSIKAEFNKTRAMGGQGADSGTKVANQLAQLTAHTAELKDIFITEPSQISDAEKQIVTQLANINSSLEHNNQPAQQLEKLQSTIERLVASLAQVECNVEVVNEPVPGIDLLLKTLADTIEGSIYPLVRAMEGKLDIDLRTHSKLENIFERLRAMDTEGSTRKVQHNPLSGEKE
ncbi:DNA repair ATPase [Agaribacterium sp. ZY112]|uniref:DNA repair ATPase n=1 Tax=Agaribacterium sp. ZY112 TaxID=3233574 RepID=UPI003525AA0D